MNRRPFVVASILLVALCIHAITRFALHVPVDRRGYDAIDYVLLHGAAQVYEADSPVRPTGVYTKEPPVRQVSISIRESPVRPTDVTGVSINEGYDTPTMIEHLRFLPNLRHIAVVPHALTQSRTTTTDAENADIGQLSDAFPHIEIEIVRVQPIPSE
ncbi:MAG: hypothetical protein WBD31_23820 [Rubripirellula sp.]